MIEGEALKDEQTRRLAEALARAALRKRNDEVATVDDLSARARTEQSYLSALRNLHLMTQGASIPQVLLDLPPPTLRMGDEPNDRKGSLPGRTLKSVPTATPIARDAMDVPLEFALPSTSQRPLEFSMPQPPAVKPNFPRRQLRPGEMEEIVARLMPRVDPATEAMAAAEFQVQPPTGSQPLSPPNAVSSREEMRRQWQHTHGVDPPTEALATAESPQDARDNPLYKLDTIGRAIANIATFYSADELAATLDALTHPLLNRGSAAGTFAERKKENLATERATDAADAKHRYSYQKSGEILGAAAILPRLAIAAPQMLRSITAQRAAQRAAPTIAASFPTSASCR
jgi:hypothetical protein